MKTAAFFAVLFFAFSSAARAQHTAIAGQLLDENGQPLKNAEVRIQSYDPKIGGFGLRTDGQGKFSANMLPPAIYRVSFLVDGQEAFTANKIWTKVGDPWRIDYSMRRALVTMSTAHSKKIRRFVWQQERTGSQIGGHWVETGSADGNETQAERLDTEQGMSAMRAMQHGPVGNLGGGH